MKPTGNDKYPDSSKPYRSQRLSSPETQVLTNNLATLKLGRGTWRLQGFYCVSAGAQAFPCLFFAVSRRAQAVEQFPVGTTVATARGELLPCVFLMWNSNAAAMCMSMTSGYAVEVDVLDDELIHFWGSHGSEVIKYVKVGDLPPRDPDLSDRER